MNAAALAQVAQLYSWFLLAALLGFVMLIARFYQKFSGEKTYYLAFLLPITLMGASAVRRNQLSAIGGDPFAALLGAAGGAILTVLIVRLYRQMTRAR